MKPRSRSSSPTRWTGTCFPIKVEGVGAAAGSNDEGGVELPNDGIPRSATQDSDPESWGVPLLTDAVEDEPAVGTTGLAAVSMATDTLPTSRPSMPVCRFCMCRFSLRAPASRFISSFSRSAFSFCLSPPSIQSGLASLYRQSISSAEHATQTGRSSSHFLRRRRQVQQPSELLDLAGVRSCAVIVVGHRAIDFGRFKQWCSFNNSRPRLLKLEAGAVLMHGTAHTEEGTLYERVGWQIIRWVRIPLVGLHLSASAVTAGRLDSHFLFLPN